MTDDKKAKVLDLVRKLLALANDKGASEHEATLAMERATALLLKHNLDIHEVEAQTGKVKETVTSQMMGIARDKLWRKLLWSSVARNNFCTVIRCRGAVQVIGRPENIAVVGEMSNWLLGQLERMGPIAANAFVAETGGMTNKYGEERGDKGKRKFLSSWYVGCVTRIYERLEDARADQEAKNIKVTALVISHTAENDAWKDANTSGLTKGHAPRITAIGAARGYLDGAKVSIIPGSRQTKEGRGGLLE